MRSNWVNGSSIICFMSLLEFWDSSGIFPSLAINSQSAWAIRYHFRASPISRQLIITLFYGFINQANTFGARSSERITSAFNYSRSRRRFSSSCMTIDFSGILKSCLTGQSRWRKNAISAHDILGELSSRLKNGRVAPRRRSGQGSIFTYADLRRFFKAFDAFTAAMMFWRLVYPCMGK